MRKEFDDMESKIRYEVGSEVFHYSISPSGSYIIVSEKVTEVVIQEAILGGVIFSAIKYKLSQSKELWEDYKLFSSPNDIESLPNLFKKLCREASINNINSVNLIKEYS